MVGLWFGNYTGVFFFVDVKVRFVGGDGMCKLGCVYGSKFLWDIFIVCERIRGFRGIWCRRVCIFFYILNFVLYVVNFKKLFLKI